MSTLSIIDAFEVDVFVNEDHAFDSEVTEYPVESGADVADHIRSRPITVTIEGVVSDSPFGRMAEVRDLDFIPSNTFYQKLLDIRNAREPVTIETSLGRFENMALQSLSVPRDAETGEALMFRAVFKQIQLVTNERTTVRVAAPRVQKKRNLGNKPAAPVTEEENSPPEPPGKTRSMLDKLIF